MFLLIKVLILIFDIKPEVPEVANCPSYMKHPVKPVTAYNANAEDISLPAIRRASSVRALKLQQPFKTSVDNSTSTQKTNFLMDNWSQKRVNNNRVHSSLEPWYFSECVFLFIK